MKFKHANSEIVLPRKNYRTLFFGIIVKNWAKKYLIYDFLKKFFDCK